MMKLKMLVVAAAISALPAMGHAQDMSKDSMKMKGDTMMMKHDAMMKKPMKGRMAHKKMNADNMSDMKMPPADGTSCPMKCPTSKGVGGLTGPQFLALQQELRDRGCGNQHVTGVLDSPTRHAIAACSKKMSVANNAAALLVAMNIGYSDADVTPAKMEE